MAWRGLLHRRLHGESERESTATGVCRVAHDWAESRQVSRAYIIQSEYWMDGWLL